MKHLVLIMASMLFSINTALAQEPQVAEEAIEACIDTITANGDEFTTEGYCMNNSADTLKLSYKLEVEKSDKNGRSSSVQAGDFVSIPGDEKLLSTVTINKRKDTYLKIYLRIYEGEELRSKAVIKSY